MESSIQTSLCRSLSACGLPRKDVREIVNTIAKWYDSSGQKWTVERLKDLKQWYISTLAGHPSPPPWFRVSKQQTPIGIWGRIFKLKNPAKVLAILSSGSWFKEKTFSKDQQTKFYGALKGSGRHEDDFHREIYRDSLDQFISHGKKIFEGLYSQVESVSFVPTKHPPNMSSITGKTIPVSRGQAIHIASPKKELVDRAYLRSWEAIPMELIDYLDRSDRLDHIPLGLRKIYDGFSFRGDEYVGRISVIQEPELKARTVANPNRIAQAYTEPFGRVLYDLLRIIPSDCTFEQSKGIRWTQRRLSEGRTLTGSDLSNASDLLSFKECLKLVSTLIPGLWNNPDFQDDVRFFSQLSRGNWYTPWDKGSVTWEVGQPLGLYPSFALMSVAHNLIGCIAAHMSNLDPYDSFRIIGDDIIMDTRMYREYSIYIRYMQGELNLTKTVTSNKVAEFAGRIITPDRTFLKTIKFSNPSDDSFMEIISTLGPQSVSLFRPRQRHMWDTFKYVPGVVVDGPWSQDSFGVPLQERYDWYLNRSGLANERLEPDPQKDTVELRLLNLSLSDQGTGKESISQSLPFPIDDAYLASLVDSHPKEISKNPLHRNGLSHLENLEKVRYSQDFSPFGHEPTSLTPEVVVDTTVPSDQGYERSRLYDEINSLNDQLHELIEGDGGFSSESLKLIKQLNNLKKQLTSELSQVESNLRVKAAHTPSNTRER